MSKKAQIVELLSRGLSTRDVAEIVGCQDGYVRAARRRAEQPGSDAAYSRKYRALHPERSRAARARYYAQPEKLAAKREYQKLWMRQYRARKEGSRT